MLASAMVLRALIAALLSCASASLPAGAQAVAVPDCTVDGTLADDEGLKLDIVYRCRAAEPWCARRQRGHSR